MVNIMKYAQLIPLVNKILSEYGSMRLTLRQIYYRLVAGYNYPNKRSSYNQLSSQLVRAREEQLIDGNRIEDRTRSFLGGYTLHALTSKGNMSFLSSHGGWGDTEDFADSVKDFFLNFWKTYELEMWRDQQYFVIVWVEKDALSRVVSDVANKYKVITAPSRGYASYSYIINAIRKLPEGKKIMVLHFSDHDSSGLDMTRDLQVRFWKYTGKEVKVERIALTYGQVQNYNLIPNPTKITDTRAEAYIAKYGMQCWELDAIEPKELQRLVIESIKKYVDEDQWKNSLKQQEEDKEELKEVFAEWRTKLAELT